MHLLTFWIGVSLTCAVTKKGRSSVKIKTHLKLRISYTRVAFWFTVFSIHVFTMLYTRQSVKRFSRFKITECCAYDEGLHLKFVAFRWVKINICISEVLLRAYRAIRKTAVLRLFRSLIEEQRSVCGTVCGRKTLGKILEIFCQYGVSEIL